MTDQIFIDAKRASRQLNLLPDEKINATLLKLAQATEQAEAKIL